MKRRIDGGAILSERGIPCAPRWLADGRLSFSYGASGVETMEYYFAREFDSNQIVFRRGVFDCFRCYLTEAVAPPWGAERAAGSGDPGGAGAEGAGSGAAVEDPAAASWAGAGESAATGTAGAAWAKAPAAKLFSPEYRNAEIWPFSICADWHCLGAVFRIGVYALEESMVFCLTAPEDAPEGAGWRLSFHESAQLVPAETGDFLLGARGMRRQWLEWERRGGALEGGFHEEPDAGSPAAGDARAAASAGERGGEPDGAGAGLGGGAASRSADVFFRLGSSHAFTASRTPSNSRIALDIPRLAPGAQYVFALTPGTDRAECAAKNRRLAAGFAQALARQRRRYDAARSRSPRLACANAPLCDFMAFAPVYHESLKTPGQPGGLRAKTTRYWIWGFDSMMAGDAAIYWGDAELARDMLGFIERSAGPGARLAHAYTTANTPASFMTETARGMYIILLHHYWALTGDAAPVFRHYGFAKEIMESALAQSAGDNDGRAGGLVTGTSLFPDFPGFLGENGADVSLFNNTLTYSALRAMETLALIAGDAATAGRLQAFLAATRRNFAGALFDPELGMFANSADAATLERRRAVNAGGVVWENDFALELVGEKDGPCMDFIEKHCVSGAYFRAIPLWDGAFDGDANQLHCTWPVVDGYMVRLASRAGNAALLRKWAGWVAYWTELLLCPEGVSCLVETDRPDTDSWNCEHGTFQAYTMRKWYEDVLHGYLGIVPDCGGIGFSPSGVGGYRLENLHYRGLRCNIECGGEGRYIGSLRVGGETLAGTCKIPEAALRRNSRKTAAAPEAGGGEAAGSAGRGAGGETGGGEAGRKAAVDIHVSLRAEPRPLELRSCYNAAPGDFRLGGGGLSFTVCGAGFATIGIYAQKPCAVLLDGEPAPCGRDPATGLMRVEAVLKPGAPLRVEARTIPI
ncbi:MAG: hypothetical protein LBL83_10080 [Clostridiales bacterium]|jgi:hypothetical protein|nr:hypothetical protein [Clostridiales bacterium]